MKTQRIVIIVTAIWEVFLLKNILTCSNFSSKFYISFLQERLMVDASAHNDTGYSWKFIKLFHNKIYIFIADFIDKYLQYWDPPYLISVFSIIGTFGILYGIWHIIAAKKRNKTALMVLAGLACLPLIILFNVPLPAISKEAIVTFPFYVFSLYGLWQFCKRHKTKGIIIVCILLILSIWFYLVFKDSTTHIFC
jgi:hypothetical protein